LNDEARGREFIKVDEWMNGWMDGGRMIFDHLKHTLLLA
jgi:hypothetical protein